MNKTANKTPNNDASPELKVRAVYTKEFKVAVVARLRARDQSAAALALELGIRRNMLYKWARQLDQHGPESSFRPRGRKPADQESEVVKLRGQVARLEQEVDILKKFDAYLKRLKR